MKALEDKEKEEVLRKLLIQQRENVYCTGVLDKPTDCWNISKIKVYEVEVGGYWGREMGIYYTYLVYTNGQWQKARLVIHEERYRGGYGERCSEGDYTVKIVLDSEVVAEGSWSYYSCVPPYSTRWAYLSLKLVKPVILAIVDPFVVHIIVPKHNPFNSAIPLLG
jgi:hypothetical protein